MKGPDSSWAPRSGKAAASSTPGTVEFLSQHDLGPGAGPQRSRIHEISRLSSTSAGSYMSGTSSLRQFPDSLDDLDKVTFPQLDGYLDDVDELLIVPFRVLPLRELRFEREQGIQIATAIPRSGRAGCKLWRSPPRSGENYPGTATPGRRPSLRAGPAGGHKRN